MQNNKYKGKRGWLSNVVNLLSNISFLQRARSVTGSYINESFSNDETLPRSETTKGEIFRARRIEGFASDCFTNLQLRSSIHEKIMKTQKFLNSKIKDNLSHLSAFARSVSTMIKIGEQSETSFTEFVFLHIKDRKTACRLRSEDL